MKTITVVGLGYVGLPLACCASKKGCEVHGLDIDKEKVATINQHTSPIDDAYVVSHFSSGTCTIQATTNANDCIPKSDVVILCVPTPITREHTPDLGPLKAATAAVAPLLEENSLFIIESTIYPGTIEEIIAPIIQKESKHANSILIAHCPERIDPGNTTWTIENLPRVIGGLTPEAATAAKKFYQGLIDADITVLSSVKSAEATKIMENTFRDVNIAFMNEMARSFDKAGIDITEVIRGAATKPFAFLPHYPGAGVGGHCISIDPYYLISRAKELGFDHKFLSLAREINEHMPQYTIELLEELLTKKNKKLMEVTVGILGVAYKAGVDDMRESPALKVIADLRAKKIRHEVFDPYVQSHSTADSLQSLLKKSDAIILVTDHAEFKKISAPELAANNIIAIVDGRNCLDGSAIKQAGILYHGIGRQ